MFKFKKLMMAFGVLLVSQIICISAISSAVLAKDDGFIYGDVNGDKAINAMDFAYMRQYLLGIISEFKSDSGIKAADVDGNGTFNAIDFAVMRKYLLGIIDEFPANQVVTPTATPTSSDFMQVKPSIVDVEMSFLNRDNIVLLWNKVEGAVSYEVYRDDVLIGTTSDTSYEDIIDGLYYTYSIKAVNSLGEHSLFSPKVMVNNIDAVLNKDTVFEEDRYFMNLNIEDGAIFDLNGHKLNVKGNLYQEGMIKINSGNLIVGKYIIGNDGILQMTKEDDYVYVGGDFITNSSYDFYKDGTEYLSAGIMEVKGNFISNRNSDSSEKVGCYPAGGSHKVILSGKEEQVIKYNGFWLEFNELEIKNEAGVKFEDLMPVIKKIRGNYKVIGVLEFHKSPQIIGDVKIDGDLKISSGEIDLAGYNLTVTGNLNQISENESSLVKVNGGSLKVLGNYSITSGTEFGTKDISAVLKMTNEDDYVFVGGDFIIKGYAPMVEREKYFDRIKGDLTAGTLEVKGDFGCTGFFGSYVAAGTGTNKVILSGTKEQVVYNDSGWLVLNKLEIKNEDGVRFTFTTPISSMSGNYKIIGEASPIIGGISGDVTIDGNLTIVDQEIDLAGYNLTVKGNLNQFSAASTSEKKPCKLKVNGGKLIVAGDYTIGYNIDQNQPDFIYSPGSILEMTNEEDYVYIGGNFTTYSNVDHSTYLTAGTLEVKGNFTQASSTGSPLNFAASGTHKTILSGDSVQTITFQVPTASSFNILKLAKPIDTGYIFNTTPVWKTLVQ